MTVQVEKQWSGKATCDSCGATLIFGVNDIKVELVPNHNPTHTALEVREYSIKCVCGQRVVIQNIADIDIFATNPYILPAKIRERLDRKFRIDDDKIHRLAMR